MIQYRVSFITLSWNLLWYACTCTCMYCACTCMCAVRACALAVHACAVHVQHTCALAVRACVVHALCSLSHMTTESLNS